MVLGGTVFTISTN